MKNFFVLLFVFVSALNAWNIHDNGKKDVGLVDKKTSADLVSKNIVQSKSVRRSNQQRNRSSIGVADVPGK
jgi:hypothetical protein